MKSLEELVFHASDADLVAWSPTLRDIAEHNAYYTGQILYVRVARLVEPGQGRKVTPFELSGPRELCLPVSFPDRAGEHIVTHHGKVPGRIAS